jgi:signal transduction histidine kinase/ActR/RegA family two-component response regulator
MKNLKTGSSVTEGGGDRKYPIPPRPSTPEDLHVVLDIGAELRESEERFRALVTATSTVVYRMSPDWAEMRELHGQGFIDDGTGVSTNWLESYIPAEDQPLVMDTIAKAIASRSVFELEHRVRRVDGTLGWTLSRAVPLLNEEGEIREWFGAATDVTSRKELELAAANTAKQKDEFMAVLSHELRNLLSPLRNGAEIARLIARPDANGPLGQVIEMMQRQVGRLTHLVDDLLDASRASVAKIQLHTKPVLLADVVATSIESCRAFIEAHRHSIQIQTQDDVVVDADFQRLAQVFDNLLSNSAKYMPPGGRIRVTVLRQEDRAVVSVTDAGRGIPKEDLDRVFDLFVQVPGREGHQGGLGIGLYLARAIVERHGGTIEAESAGRGRGSTFTVKLPISQTSADALRVVPLRSAGLLAAGGRRLSILVADDNEEAANSLATLLELAGHEVVIASDGAEAVECASERKFDLIFLDIWMQRLDGLAAAERIRSLPVAGQPVLVATTGFGQKQDRERSRAAGFDIHLVKPLELDSLRELLTTVTERRADEETRAYRGQA